MIGNGSISYMEACKVLEKLYGGEQVLYIVICVSENGVSIERVTKEELEKRLKDDDYGVPCRDMQKQPLHRDFNEWQEGLYIIKGKFIVPKPKEKVIEWEVE